MTGPDAPPSPSGPGESAEEWTGCHAGSQGIVSDGDF